jgi:DNA-directed RNA polymerase sigma subunit (sigma70/sigma32)
MKDQFRLRNLIAQNIGKLKVSKRVRDILKYRFGSLDESHSLEDTGKRFGISKQRVDEIIKEVESKIKKLIK